MSRIFYANAGPCLACSEVAGTSGQVLRGIHATSSPRALTSKWAARQRFLSTYSGNSKGVGEFTYPHPCRFSALQIYSASLALSSSPIFCCCSPPPERVPQLPWGIFKDSDFYVLRAPLISLYFPAGKGGSRTLPISRAISAQISQSELFRRLQSSFTSPQMGRRKVNKQLENFRPSVRADPFVSHA